eukprot:scaffold192727_cov31-Tisochrysis_lutea.AAC.3
MQQVARRFANDGTVRMRHHLQAIGKEDMVGARASMVPDFCSIVETDCIHIGSQRVGCYRMRTGSSPWFTLRRKPIVPHGTYNRSLWCAQRTPHSSLLSPLGSGRGADANGRGRLIGAQLYPLSQARRTVVIETTIKVA